jgi:hypothetical protein
MNRRQFIQKTASMSVIFSLTSNFVVAKDGNKIKSKTLLISSEISTQISQIYGLDSRNIHSITITDDPIYQWYSTICKNIPHGAPLDGFTNWTDYVFFEGLFREDGRKIRLLSDVILTNTNGVNSKAFYWTAQS